MEIWVNIGSGDGLLSEGNKPLLQEQMFFMQNLIQIFLGPMSLDSKDGVGWGGL